MNPVKISSLIFFATVSTLIIFNCAKSTDKDKAAGAKKSYDFTAAASAAISLKAAALQLSQDSKNNSAAPKLTDGPTLCSSVVCFTPTKLTGTYYGTGFLIQSSGSGLVAYFGQDSWSSITGTSASYNFDSATPVTNAGNLTCCGGTGDLASENTYISDAIYLFGYLDATFTVSGVTGNTSMNREFTVRFVMADGAISGGIRGDVLLKDPSDGVFKWIDKSVSAGGNVGDGTLVSTRPTTPVTMDSSVTAWTNPFGTSQGNQTIPVIYAPILPESGTGVFQISETDLSTTGKVYNYKFDPTNFVMFPTLQRSSDINMIYSYTQLLSKIHLGGLPHSQQTKGVGSPAGTVLTVTGP